jgi:hypothetical protein
MIGRGLKSMLIFARGPKRRLCDRSALWFVTGEWQACGLETVVAAVLNTKLYITAVYANVAA